MRCDTGYDMKWNAHYYFYNLCSNRVVKELQAFDIVNSRACGNDIGLGHVLYLFCVRKLNGFGETRV